MTNQPQHPANYPDQPAAGPVYPPTAAPYPPAPPAYPAAPGYPAGAYSAPVTPVDPNTSTNTVWVWLAVLLPLTSIVALFVIDWNGMFNDMIAMIEQASRTQTDGAFAGTVLTWQLSLLQQTWWVWGLTFLVSVLSIVFCALDYMQLRKRGIPKQFHWAWVLLSMFFGLGILVWIIGRTVVLRKQQLKAIAPMIVYIVTIVAAIVASFVLIFGIILPIFTQFAEQLGGL